MDQLGIPYGLVNEDRLRAGALEADFDVLVFGPAGPAGRGDARTIVGGIERRFGPLAYKKSAQFPRLGAFDHSDDITGGMGLVGVRNLERFVQQGGRLVTIGSANTVPVDYGIVKGFDIRRPDGLLIPGSILRLEQDEKAHPALVGYRDSVGAYFGNGPILDFTAGTPPERTRVLLRFAATDVLLSGFAQNPGPLLGKPAVVEVGVERGSVVMFAVDPIYRWLTYGTFDLLFNVMFGPADVSTRVEH